MKLKTWRAPVWAAVTYTEPNFRAFSRRRGTPLEALPEARPQTTAPPPGVLPGDIPDVKTLQSVLETAVQPRFPAAPVRARTAVVSPDVDLVAERGWVYEALPELFTGGETTFLLALHAYLTNAPTRAGFITRMRAVVKKLEGIPGNESGAQRHAACLFLQDAGRSSCCSFQFFLVADRCLWSGCMSPFLLLAVPVLV